MTIAILTLMILFQAQATELHQDGFDIEFDFRPVGFGGSEAQQGLGVNFIYTLPGKPVTFSLEPFYDHTNYNSLPNGDPYNYDDHQIGLNYSLRYKNHAIISGFSDNVNQVQPPYLQLGYGYRLLGARHLEIWLRSFFKAPLMATDTEYRTFHMYHIDFPIRIR